MRKTDGENDPALPKQAALGPSVCVPIPKTFDKLCDQFVTTFIHYRLHSRALHDNHLATPLTRNAIQLSDSLSNSDIKYVGAPHRRWKPATATDTLRHRPRSPERKSLGRVIYHTNFCAGQCAYCTNRPKAFWQCFGGRVTLIERLISSSEERTSSLDGRPAGYIRHSGGSR